jgi:hypothetical protein
MKNSKIFDFSKDNINPLKTWLDAVDFLKSFVSSFGRVEISVYTKTRSNQQNRALHLYWSQLARALNEEGNTYLSSRGKQLKFTSYKIENDWREIMQEMFGIFSTKDLTTQMINDIYDCINLDYSIKYGVYVEFPNWQSFLNKMDYEQNERNE